MDKEELKELEGQLRKILIDSKIFGYGLIIAGDDPPHELCGIQIDLFGDAFVRIEPTGEGTITFKLNEGDEVYRSPADELLEAILDNPNSPFIYSKIRAYLKSRNRK